MLTAFVPGVAIYRAVETSSCLDDMTQLDCHSEPTCWRHDLDRYRYLTHGITAAFQAAAAVFFIVALRLSPGSGAPDAADVDSPVTSSRRVPGVLLGNSAERRTPVCSDVRPGASDVTPEVINIASGQSPERYGSVYDTPM